MEQLLFEFLIEINRKQWKKMKKLERNTADLVCKTSQVQSERSNRVKLDGPTKSGRSWAKLDGDLGQSGRFMTIVDGLLSHSGRSFIWKWTVQQIQHDKYLWQKYIFDISDIRSKNQLFIKIVVSYSRTKVDCLKTNKTVIRIKVDGLPRINIQDDPMT